MIPVGRRYRRIERHAAELLVVDAEVTDRDGQAAVVVAPEVVGVCRSDLRELADERHMRRDFGHEIVARVVGTRPDGLLPVGQRVVYDPHPPVDRTCGFGELVELYGPVPTLQTALVPVDDGVPSLSAVFAEPLACAVHCVRRLETASAAIGLPVNAPVAVIGAGMAGGLITAVIETRGVPVRLTNRGRGRLDFLSSRRFLPATVLDADAATATNTRPANRIFPRLVLATAMATPETLRVATRLLTPGGLLLLFAGTDPTTELWNTPLDAVRRGEQLVTLHGEDGDLHLAGTHGALPGDFRQSLALLHDGHSAGLADRVASLVTKELTLDEASRELPRRRTSGFAGKAVVHPITTPPRSRSDRCTYRATTTPPSSST